MLFRLLLAVGVNAGLSAGVRSGLSDGSSDGAAVGNPVRVAAVRSITLTSATAGVARTGLIFPAGSPLQAASLRRGMNSYTTSFAGITFPDQVIADAIRLAEGRTRGVHRYGIRTARSEADGRRTCLLTIEANRGRWIASGAHGEFIDFLADRYCPPSVDPVGNRNWKRNVKFFLSK